MQTFLPYPSFDASARFLDRARLGKQRLETKQILQALRGESKAWANHPITNMWRGYEWALTQYGIAICLEWIGRGYKDSLLPWFQEREQEFVQSSDVCRFPPWLGNLALHASHRGRLLAKDPVWYGQWGWTDPPCDHVIYMTLPTESVRPIKP